MAREFGSTEAAEKAVLEILLEGTDVERMVLEREVYGHPEREEIVRRAQRQAEVILTEKALIKRGMNIAARLLSGRL